MVVGWEEQENVEKLHKVMTKYFWLLTSISLFENTTRKNDINL